VLHDGPAAPPVDLPPLVGFLSSFSARPDGVYFPVREGRNRFGSDPSQVDHALPWDRAMSGRHFALMVRNGRVRVLDENSTNATRVDGVEIWGDAEDANHGSIIQAGDTTFELTLIPSRSAARKVGGDA
jgi:pSer/pThr/pTyr-binding forkhead associated (FHA) protein